MIPRIALIILLLCAPFLSLAREDIAPRKDWRVKPEGLRATTNTAQLHPLLLGMTADWSFRGGEKQSFDLRLPSPPPAHLMLTWQTLRNTKVAIEHYDEQTARWSAVEEKPAGRYLEKFELKDFAEGWIRLTVHAEGTTQTISVKNIGLYELTPQRDDYWLVIGASIQAQSIRQEVFHTEVTKQFPDYDPVIFNRAVSGWTTTNLLKALPEILAEHPEASYVCIHIGGNNVSRDRPYPGGAELLRNELEQILKMIQEQGKIPILSRLSYRAYKTKGGVPPEENGSGPYVENIYDPLIEQYCPVFVDPETGVGVVDAYNWFKEHQDQLSSDGIHVRPAGQQAWNVLWATGAGGVIYGKQ